MRLLQPSSMVQISKKSPDRLLDRALRIIKTGFGQPSLFNTDAIVQEMVRQGKSLEDARSGGASGCVEAGIFGKENYSLTGYFNLPKVLEITLHGGLDPRTGKRIGAATGGAADFATYDELYEAFRKTGQPLRRYQGPGKQHHREDLRRVPAGAVPVAAHRRLHRPGARLS